MSIIIHPGRCDQSKECSCPQVCSQEAWCWNEKDGGWFIDESKCINCGVCVHVCQAEAVIFAATEEEKEGVLKEIQEDTEHTPETLFVERYGGVPVAEDIVLTATNFESTVSNGLVLVEFFNEGSVKCLVKAPPYHEFAPNYKVYKVDTDSEPDLKLKYDVDVLPSMLLLKDGKEIGRVESFVADVEVLKSRLIMLSSPYHL